MATTRNNKQCKCKLQYAVVVFALYQSEEGGGLLYPFPNATQTQPKR